jgi:hypothetical protein
MTLVPGVAICEQDHTDERDCEDQKRKGNRSVNRTDFGGDSIVWRNMESWQTTATTASGGIHLN